MSKRKNMLLREQAPTQHILSFCRMAKLLLTLYSILVKNKVFFGVRNIKKGDYFAKKFTNCLVNFGSQIKRNVIYYKTVILFY